MRIGSCLLNMSAVLAACLVQAGVEVSLAWAQGTATLTGQVSSAEEGPLEGVVVSAKRDGATFTVSVVTDKEGRYGFPSGKLEPGHYRLSIRAGGYELDSPSKAVSAVQPATAEIKLRASKNIASQLTDGEWLASMPGTDSQKKILLGCNSCHTLQRIVRSSHDAAKFLQVFKRMGGYYPGSTPLHPQRLVGDIERNLTRGADLDAAARYLASINLSGVTSWEYKLKFFPRPTGRATRVVVTEYDLPRATIEPHDVILDSGMVWFAEFGDQLLGKMDPKTGKVTEYPIPELKKGFPTGTLDLESGADGNSLWIGLMYQAGIAKFDKRSERFQLFALPQEWQSDSAQMGMVTPTHANVDGKVWTKNNAQNALIRIDLASGKLEVARHPERPRDQPPDLPIWDSGRSPEQPLSSGFRRRTDRQGRCQDRRDHGLQDADRQFTAAARPGRRPGPAVVCRIWRRRHRPVRSQDREDHGMAGGDAVERSLRRHA